MSIKNLPETILLYINTFIGCNILIFCKKKGNIYVFPMFYYNLKSFQKSALCIPKKSFFTIFGIHHAKVTFSNSSKLYMIDYQRSSDEDELRHSMSYFRDDLEHCNSCFEYISRGIKTNVSWKTYNNYKIVSYNSGR